MSDERSSPSQMSNADTRIKSDALLAEGMGEEEALGADAGAGNAGQPTAPASPLVPDEAGIDDWDGIGMAGSPEEVELVPLETLAQGDAANDNWDDEDDNAYEESDEALPGDSEEAAIDTDLLNTTERGRFGDADPGPNQRSEDGD